MFAVPGKSYSKFLEVIFIFDKSGSIYEKAHHPKNKF